MKSRLMRTVIVTSLLTALMGSALAIYGPQLADRISGKNAVTLQPAVYTGPEVAAQDNNPATPPPQQPVLRSRSRRSAARYSSEPQYNDPQYSSAAQPTDSYGEPVPARRDRSTEDSAMIVAGSAGTGAAIGAIAGGGKGAAIGAISGGVAGFIFDRLTAHK